MAILAKLDAWTTADLLHMSMQNVQFGRIIRSYFIPALKKNNFSHLKINYMDIDKPFQGCLV